ncbi:MAG: hypothetical protein ACJATI_003732 [Halioglobus sp.]|jgi:hypothetical protein
MWELNLKANYLFYVHIFFFYQSILIFVIPFLIGIVFKLNAPLFILGYGLLYIFGFYILSWIIIPILIVLYDFLYKKLKLYGAFTALLIFTILASIYGFEIFNLSKGDESRFYFELITSPLFLWIIYVIREHDFK